MTNDTATTAPIASDGQNATLTKLYIGSMPYDWTAENLEEMFKPYGRVTSAAVVADQSTKRSKGFGFVEFETAAEAQKAIGEVNGRAIEGRSLLVREARPHVDRSMERSNGVRRERLAITNSIDNVESTDTSGRSYGNRRGWW
ncbi:MAG TPA: hypothetical protein VGM92_02630 [Candidatus Kapabacteria bacterium]|jgi:RNA recognition motif-containing protein